MCHIREDKRLFASAFFGKVVKSGRACQAELGGVAWPARQEPPGQKGGLGGRSAGGSTQASDCRRTRASIVRWVGKADGWKLSALSKNEATDLHENKGSRSVKTRNEPKGNAHPPSAYRCRRSGGTKPRS